jgi:hypothetical protein
MKTIPQLNSLLVTAGSDVVYHREEGGTDCPCLTYEGFRDPAWHLANPGAPVCNEQGKLGSIVTHITVKAAVQPALAGTRRVTSRRVEALLGDVQHDDHLGIFPVTWGSATLRFDDWSEDGEDYILYDNRRFIPVGSDKVPDIDGDPNHHWEVGLRWVKNARP